MDCRSVFDYIAAEEDSYSEEMAVYSWQSDLNCFGTMASNYSLKQLRV